MKLLSLLVLGTFAAFANAAAVDNTLVGRDCGGQGDSCSKDSDCCEGKTCTREPFGYSNKFCSR